MGRTPKQGIAYFQADVDMFQDRKIKRLLRAAGSKGFTIYIYLLTYIYRDKGYFYEWDKHSAFDISDDLNFSENVVEEAIKACCSIGLFDKDLYSEKSVLTSESIQQRWQKIVTDANRTLTEINPEIEIQEGKPLFLSSKNELSGEETPEKSRETPQRKEKESKEKKSKAYTPDDVEQIYQTYPRKVGKGKAKKKIKKSLKELSKEESIRDPVQWLLDRVTTFAESPKGQAGEYCPYPATWFNQERYFDDEQEWQKQQINGTNSNRQRAGSSGSRADQYFDRNKDVISRFPNGNTVNGSNEVGSKGAASSN